MIGRRREVGNGSERWGGEYGMTVGFGRGWEIHG